MGVVVAMVVLFTGANLFLDYRLSRQQTQEHMADLTRSMARTIRGDLYFKRQHNLRSTIQSFSYHDNIQEIGILDPEGSIHAWGDLHSGNSQPEQITAPEDFINFKGTRLWREKDMICILAPVMGEAAQPLGFVYLSATTTGEDRLLREKMARGLIIGGFLGVIGSIIGYLSGLRLTHSLKALTRATGDLAQGREPTRLTSTSRDELGQLSTAFNDMVDSRQKAEASLQRSRQHLLFILDETPLAYIEWNLDFRVVNWNKAAERIFGFSKEEAIGQHPLSLIVPEELHPRIEEIWTSILSETGGTSSLNENVRSDGARIQCQWNNTVIRDPSGKITAVASLVDDVTESIKNQERMREAMEAAQQATLAKSAFLANMSHEIRTPMNGVIGLTDLLLESELLPEQRSYVDIIRSSGEMLLTIINDILDLSKIESGKLELSERTFDLKDCLNTAFHLFNRNLDAKRLTHKVELDPTMPRFVKGDPIRLRQIIYNLIGNAVKFTDQGSIILTARCQEVDEGQNRIEVSVKDSGCGISSGRIEHIFDPFDQGDTSSTRTHGGTGLGLTICKRLCEIMQGGIWIAETSEKGTEFLFNVVLETASSEEADRMSVAGKTRQVKKENSLNILVAEDNPVNRLVTQRILKRLGFDCLTAEDGAQAVEMAIAGPCDLVFMDVQMPVMDGLAASKAIRDKLGTAVHITALTASAIEGDRERCMAAGMDDYLAKPIDIHAVSEVVRKVDRLKRQKS